MENSKKINNQKIDKTQENINNNIRRSELYEITFKESAEETKRRKEKFSIGNNRKEENIYVNKTGEALCVVNHIFDKIDNEEVLTCLEVFEPYKKLACEYIKTSKEIETDDDILPILPLIYNINKVIYGKEKKRNIIIADTENLSNYLSKSGLIATTFLSGTDEPIETEYLSIFKDTNLILIGNFCTELKENLEKVANKVVTINNEKEYFKFCEEKLINNPHLKEKTDEKSDDEMLVIQDIQLCVELFGYNRYLEEIKKKDILPDELLELADEELKKL